MDSKRFKSDALAKAKELIDDHPFELKSFKIGSLATTREFIDVHPFQPISGAVYTAPIMNQAGAVSSAPFELKSFKIGSLAKTVGHAVEILFPP